MKPRKEYTGQEKRDAVRWSDNIPLEFKLVSEQEEAALEGKESAFTHNISAKGVCIEIKQLDENLKDELISGRLKMLLEIKLPVSKEPVLALAKVSWLSKLWKEKGATEGKYIMGLKFLDTTTSSRDMIIDYILKSYAGWFSEKVRRNE